MTSTASEPSAEPQVVFRPGKKRKVYRQRGDDTDVEPPEEGAETNAERLRAETPSAAQDPRTGDSGEGALSVAEAMRLRNARKVRIGGVGFRAGSTARQNDDGVRDSEQSLVLHEDGAEGPDSIIGGMERRFARQTGLIGEAVNKHMEDYIEGELARRKRQHESAATEPDAGIKEIGFIAGEASSSLVPEKPRVAPQSAARGKLQEIDLGDEARARNVAMTERARRRLDGEQVEEEDLATTPKKVRLGKDGKPWRARNRRGSDAIKRDQLVEEFLRENRLDVYDLPPESSGAGSGADVSDGNDLAADERIAEEFQREFMDAMMQRNRRRPAVNAPKTGPNKTVQEEVLRGPKLGGSRNQRAAMRDRLLKEQVEKKR